MPKASVNRSIECKKEQLIDLVLDVKKYPQFVPFCLDSNVHEKKENGDFLIMIADLTIGKGPLKDTYRSNVKYNKKKDSIYVTNLDGPLKHLENRWHFRQVNKITEVSFNVDFELKNNFLNIIMTKSFKFGLDKIADAFEKRAEELFGKI